MPDFFRFPHTPHIAWLATGAPRDDKVLSPAEAEDILSGPVVLEEKLDGANLGFSVSPDGVLARRTGASTCPALPRPVRPPGPLAGRARRQALRRPGHAPGGLGEWCAARHSLDYATLPDWWMLFDVYDRQEQRFWSTTRRNAWAAEMGFKTVPRLYTGEVTLDQLRDWVHAHDSQFRQGHLEGIVVRRENADWLENRAKLVRADFTQTIEAHWKSRALEWNRVV